MIEDFSKLRITGWSKLDRKCQACQQPHAEIEFIFSCKGLPAPYWQEGLFARAWHWKCLPDYLQQWQQADEHAIFEHAQTPL